MSGVIRIFGRLRDWSHTAAGRRTGQFISIALSGLIILLLVRAIQRIGWTNLITVLPDAPLAVLAFWLCFAGQYLIQPVADWMIFRRWWKLRFADLAIFLRKHALNETLFAYAGEGWLLAWAARRQGLEFDPDNPPSIAGRGTGPGTPPGENPFADVKDVAITSGLAGNLFTLVMLLLAIAMGAASALGGSIEPSLLRQAGIGFSVLVVLNIVILFNRGRLFTLPFVANVRSFAWHFGRVSVGHALLVGSWIAALPLVGVEAWVLLGALRLVVARLPLPNKQLLFATTAAALVGEAAPAVAALMAAQGVLTLAGHALSWLAAGAIDARRAA
ncbi:hypothetical protein FHS79_000449 [Polymorphobacter multimanifer]|uniref:Uncharacterized protein n=1 Tax=Polymorphobacter multimanifer TaxID=1070431 RepID=A0A841L8Y5_9SPHN|nr:hypothetical protein [Polymorphobacter multimanifer]MBB6226295.1 hypothetical protein [Polymorphobacter multimanifer]